MNTIEFTPEELAAFREELFSGFTDAQFNLAIAECKRRNLVPGQHVFFQLRNSSEWDASIGASIKTKKLTRVTTIDAFRLISQRTGEYAGQGKAKFYYLDDKRSPSIVSEIPLPHPTLENTPKEPWACSVPIYRKGFVEPVEVVCRFDAYAVTRKSGNSTVLTEMWSRRGPEQLAKCSEAASRRVAFGEELGSFYLAEELSREDADNKPAVEAPSVPVTEAPKAAVVPEINHAPATPTTEPRPNEAKPKPKKSAKDATITEVILDKVEVVADHPKIDKPAPVVDVKIDEPVQKMETAPKSNNDRLRDLMTAGVPKDPLKNYLIAKAGVAEIKLIPKEKLVELIEKLEFMTPEQAKEEVTKPEPKRAELLPEEEGAF